MCEKSGFWRWLPRVTIRGVRAFPQDLFWVIRAVSGRVIRAIRPSMIMVTIRNPFYEFFIGIMALFFSPMIVLLDSVSSDPCLTSTTRIAVTLLIIPSFLIMMHGIYRSWGDC